MRAEPGRRRRQCPQQQGARGCQRRLGSSLVGTRQQTEAGEQGQHCQARIAFTELRFCGAVGGVNRQHGPDAGREARGIVGMEDAAGQFDEYCGEPKCQRPFFGHHAPGDMRNQPVGEGAVGHAPGDAKADRIVLFPWVVTGQAKQRIKGGNRPEPGAGQGNRDAAACQHCAAR